MCCQDTPLEAAFMSYYKASQSFCVTSGNLCKIKGIWTLTSPHICKLLSLSLLFLSTVAFLSECSIFVVLVKGLPVFHRKLSSMLASYSWLNECGWENS